MPDDNTEIYFGHHNNFKFEGNHFLLPVVIDCSRCGETFEMLAEERAMYQRNGMTEPTMCPDCRSLKKDDVIYL